MGKRELLLVIAFALAGAVVYHVSAPPPAPGERSFSISGIAEHFRRGFRGNRASAETTTTSSYPVGPAAAELTVVMRSGEVTITGEDRSDIAAELRVHSTGYDDAEAQKLAKATVLKVEPAGIRLVATVSFPEEGRQTAAIVLRVPARLVIKMDPTSARTRIANVTAVELTNSRGETEIQKIADAVSGTHRGGELRVTETGAVKLTTIGCDVRLLRIRGDVSLNMRSGELRASELRGAIELDTANTDVELEKLENAKGLLRVDANSGSISVKGLRTEGRIEVRNANVEIAVDRPAVLTVDSEGGESVEVDVPAGGYNLDAIATDASIDMPDGGPEVTTSGQEQRAVGPVRGGGPAITIRTKGGAITMRAQ
jgi:hypothetical protein